jgi:hypothetical protein
MFPMTGCHAVPEHDVAQTIDLAPSFGQRGRPTCGRSDRQPRQLVVARACGHGLDDERGEMRSSCA